MTGKNKLAVGKLNWMAGSQFPKTILFTFVKGIIFGNSTEIYRILPVINKFNYRHLLKIVLIVIRELYSAGSIK